MIKFYDVDEKYIDFLKQYDRQVPNIKYDTLNKFVCGIVLGVNGVNYFAPVSHNTKIVKTSLPIYSKGNVISTIRFSFMFPAEFDNLTEKDFSEISKTDPKYADLLQTEYKYCKAHEAEISAKAEKVYKIGCNKNHWLNYTCCDFKKLESVYLNYRAGALTGTL
ncbi:MAG: type III toxin-antitoxin system ToxN/AbiQ family toxin [Ruminococcus sp.]|nr:type III toxin-antitoxin system ToxN/AbiQ family toxin [Ruminococcus sp.]MCM1382608.1 type III toxin-antitoxin system ToxN/AbiQ family toxin [Muribaculaceae bacterium]MCM1480972.1 type III toxin-antitoxin system ToxN/AbiQ family toxin [Muribaculaceae bacterium]